MTKDYNVLLLDNAHTISSERELKLSTLNIGQLGELITILVKEYNSRDNITFTLNLIATLIYN